MHLHFERNINTKCDCTILSLSWMGKVPDDIPEDEGWKLNRTNYYQEGWLATGNIRGIVGVTFTTSHCRKNMDYPLRTNYNLRGHRSDVILVKWNEPYQKLASCDSSGIIFVWIKYEGRWSIELINDRNTPVTHFSWSHDGRMALICYQDGFVLVGSVAGQRYWSSMLNLESTITCGIWTPDDQQVYFGTTQGQVIVMDVHGAMVSQVQLSNDVPITSMAWSCEKFKMEEGEEAEPGVTNAAKRTFVLAVSFQNGYIYLLKSFDDVSPAHINTCLNGALGMVMEWSNSRELLAVAGTLRSNSNGMGLDGKLLEHELGLGTPASSCYYNNLVKFYTESGTCLYQAHIPCSTATVSAITWGHNDKRLFIATGTQVHIAWISRRVASLQLLCRLQIQASVGSETLLPLLPLPSRIKSLIGNLFAQTIRCCVPDLKSLRDFVSRPPLCSTRLHCTMIRHDDDSNLSSGTCYTLYLEYLGGLVPLLKGKRTSKIRPEFVIFDPQVNDNSLYFQYAAEAKSSSGSSQSTTTGNSGRTDSSDSDFEERSSRFGSPRTPRKRRVRAKRRTQNGDRAASGSGSNTLDPDSLDELAYVDTLPEQEVKLVEVTSNIWGTKFKIHGLAKTVPANLGQVTYKTSLLHLQPRQMTLVITELRDDFPTGPDPSFNPNLFSEDEEEHHSYNHNHNHSTDAAVPHVSVTSAAPDAASAAAATIAALKPPIMPQRRLNDGASAPPIAPMSPRPNRILARHKNSHGLTVNGSGAGGAVGLSPLARAESYDDDSSNESQEAAAAAATATATTVLLHQAPASCSSASPAPSCSKNITRPKTISSFKNSYSRSSSNSSCQSRHAISPLYCDGSVPTLQSPKNAVAPSDIIFERPAVPAAGQTTLMSYSSNADYANNVVQVKNALMSESMRTANSHVNPVPLNLNLNLERMDARAVKCSTTKRRDMLYIDEETQSPTPTTTANTSTAAAAAAAASTSMKRTPTVVSIAPALPDSITRSCSVGYLDSVAITPSDEALSALRKDAPNKRLILVDKRRNRHRKRQQQQADARRHKLQQTGKSKSLDSCDLLSLQTKLSSKEHEQVVRKLQEISDSSACSSAANTLCFKCRNNMNPASVCKRCQPTVNPALDEITTVAVEPAKEPTAAAAAAAATPAATAAAPAKPPPKKRFDVITSFTDSPLFTRKHRFGYGRSKDLATGSSTENSTPLLARKQENSFSFVKQLSEVRWRRKEAPASQQQQQQQQNQQQSSSNASTLERQQSETGSIACGTVEATPVEAKASVSLHTQALTTLENIISRLRDLDEGRLTPPSTPQRLPRSSPASPASSKKNKRQQSNSPIRHILNSPLLNRRQRKKPSIIESSDDEGNQTNGSGEEMGGSTANGNGNGKQYRDLETFQKAQLRQKLKRGKIEPNGSASCANPAPVRREFVMHNKAPMWNEMSQVYQLDFGGRVTQESAKNFQIEFRGKQVMQFGRIDGNAYTLDFQYPFSALQAFAVALANVTQRLK
ncbi:tubby-related protein 4 isoform X1 [Drosophila hydei]|uniref:Tubby-related protein 4 isoform X1 n=1 Tax=Drosophila hydei TaxID=7224 RepID=A0A6J1M6W1_DROHY|nr:tubby-related protein 4 isoform X1 [Drosophila hydei]XP_023176891.2 tubby-related protein 4 isoform X1 [Drosophila hydei]